MKYETKVVSDGGQDRIQSELVRWKKILDFSQADMAMKLLHTLFESDLATKMQTLPRELHEFYDGDLHFPSHASRPGVIANFVSTLDGVVSFKNPGYADGSAISGSDAGDHFIMGLLRASSDAVLIGAGTVHDTDLASIWTPAAIFPQAATLYAEYRNLLEKPLYPLTVIASGSGSLNLQRAVFLDPEIPVVIVTTTAGRKKLSEAGADALPSVDVRSLGDGVSAVTPTAILGLLQSDFAVERIVHEGGPTFFGEFLAAGVVDELFLTLSPRVAGRSPKFPRPGFVEGTEFSPSDAPDFRLVGVKQHQQHLYLRYRR